MKSNLFLSNEKIKGLTALTYSLQAPIDPKEVNKVLRALETSLLRRGIVATVTGQKVHAFQGKTPLPETITAARVYVFKLNPTPEEIKLTENLPIFRNIFLSALKAKAYSLGYIGPEGTKLIEKTPYKSDYFNYHNAFSYEVEVFEDGSIGIWLDPSTRWKCPLPNFIEYEKKRGKTKEELANELIGRDVNCPSTQTGRFFAAKISQIYLKKITEYTFSLNGKDISLYDWWTKTPECVNWLKRNNITINPEDDIIVEVKVQGYPRAYPYKVLELIIDLDKTPTEATHEKKMFEPKVRIRETEDLAKKLLGDGLNVGTINIPFNCSIITWNENTKLYGQILSLIVPDLKFGENQVLKTAGPDPFVVKYLQQYGPITKKIETRILYIVPLILMNQVATFHNIIAKNAKDLQLGNFVYDPEKIITVEKLDQFQYMLACQKAEKEDGIAVVIHPERQDIHFKAKKGLGKKLVSSQMINTDTFHKIINDPEGKYTKPLIYNAVAGIYDKNLASGEVMWLLDKPAGNLHPDLRILFIGFDVSRNPESRKEAAAYAAICDSYGKILYRKVIQSHRGEVMGKEAIRDWLFEIATDTGKELIDELVVFKDGPIRYYELPAWKEGVSEAKNILVENNLMKPEGNIRIITVIKMGPHRIYSDSYDMRASNVALIRDTDKAILVTAKPFKGTPDSLRLNIEYQIKNDLNIIDIVRIFNDLRFLDWESLYKQPKTILPLHIVQNLAKFSKEDIEIPYAPR